MKRVLVCGAGGFIGHHLVSHLKSLGYWVRGVDLKHPEFEASQADDFIIGDLRLLDVVQQVINSGGIIDEIFQLAADMGGAGYIFTGDHDSNVMHNSGMINLNIIDEATKANVKKIFYSSSACIYPEYNQLDPDNPKCSEDSAYPAAPDSEYGWEKLFSERLYLAYHRNHNIPVRIARFHNIYGPLGTWQGGREKAPAAICRKVAEADDGGTIDVWGDGQQTRSFLYIDACIDSVMRLMNSDLIGPYNIGSDEMVTINQLVETAANVANKSIRINHIDGPLGVRGRNSDNELILKDLGWAPNFPLHDGINHTYHWIQSQINNH
ncbi:MAG: NAD-dependent dehydratase [Actinobacteria bacterium]|nr:NAD-dependent dehydratase [Actinomycetota bacterium]|tara:strand:- start:15705 stop:16673 length:969 start_codon:yes stop_codon:yes gene_type:complete